MSIKCKGSINVKRIDKTLMVTKGDNVYLDFGFFDNKDGKDKFGNDGFIAQNVPRDVREANPEMRGPIIGNWKYAESRPKAKPASPPPEPERSHIAPPLPAEDGAPVEDQDNLPF